MYNSWAFRYFFGCYYKLFKVASFSWTSLNCVNWWHEAYDIFFLNYQRPWSVFRRIQHIPWVLGFYLDTTSAIIANMHMTCTPNLCKKRNLTCTGDLYFIFPSNYTLHPITVIICNMKLLTFHVGDHIFKCCWSQGITFRSETSFQEIWKNNSTFKLPSLCMLTIIL